MSNALQSPPKLLSTMAERMGVDPSKLQAILESTVIKAKNRKPTAEEVQAFLIIANKYDLNPFTREIHAFESNGSIIPIVGVDGWAAIVNRQKDFDGCEFSDSRDDQGNLIAITCKIFSKSRQHPISVTEYLSECNRDTMPWNKMPARMLRHKAFMQAARIAFGISGLFDEDDAQVVIDGNFSPSGEVKTGTAALKEKLSRIAEPSTPNPVTEEHEEPKPTRQPRKPKEKPEAPNDSVANHQPVEEPKTNPYTRFTRHWLAFEFDQCKTTKEANALAKRLCEERADLQDTIVELLDLRGAELEDAK